MKNICSDTTRYKRIIGLSEKYSDSFNSSKVRKFFQKFSSIYYYSGRVTYKRNNKMKRHPPLGIKLIIKFLELKKTYNDTHNFRKQTHGIDSMKIFLFS